MMYQDDAWEAYKSLNQRFADVIAKNYQEGDLSKYIDKEAAVRKKETAANSLNTSLGE